MREIKFRAWDKEQKYLIDSQYNDEIIESFYPGKDGTSDLTLLDVNNIFITNRFVWMKSTGLKDKNGVEIYEGDVIERLEPSIYSGVRIEVLIPNCYCNPNDDDNAIYIPSQWGVIGNIHENPELLKENTK